MQSYYILFYKRDRQENKKNFFIEANDLEECEAILKERIEPTDKYSICQFKKAKMLVLRDYSY